MPRHLLILLLALVSCLPLSAGEDPAQPFPRSKEYNWMSVKAWNDRHAKHLEMIKSGGGDLLFVGDSITEGWGGAGKDVWTKEYAPGKALNIGIGGDTTQNVLWRLANGEVAGLKPKVVVLMIGTNNFGLNGDQPADVVRGITAVVASLREKLPGAHVLLLSIFPRDANPQAGIRAKITEVNAAIAAFAAAAKGDDGKAVHYLDISKVFTEPDGSLKKEVMPDFLHLSGEGYKRWADAIRQPLSELLAKPLAAGK
jgi:lysophospholipase L1-like esterase